jgi:signal transduction histidine kinase
MPGIDPVAVLPAVSGVILLSVFAFAVRRRDHPGAIPLAAIVAAAALWAFSYAIALRTFDPVLREQLEFPIWAGRMAMPVAWIAFAFAYAGRSDLVRPFTIFVIALPHLGILLLVATEPTGLFWSNYHIVGESVATVTYDYGPAFVFDTVYSYALIVNGTIMLLGVSLVHPRRYNDQVGALVVGAAVPTATSLAWVTRNSPVPGMDFTPIALSVTGVMFGYALFRAEILTASPSVRQAGVQAALEDFSEAVVLLDEHDQVLDVNEAAIELVGTDPVSARRQSVYDLLGVEEGAFSPGTQRITLDTASGRRVFDVTVSPVTDAMDRRVGSNLLFHDVTDQQLRKQRLSVLNRVLRHNLRNDVNVIMGSASSLRDANEGRSEVLRENINNRAAALAELGTQAKKAQRVVENNEETVGTVAFDEFVTDIASEMAVSLPAVTFSCSLPAGMEIRGDLSVFETVVRNALEAAAEYADPTDPWVHIAGDSWAEGRWVDLSVSGNGAGIPEQEQVAITADEESSLEHASDLRLWLVRWGATTLGGDVSLVEGDEESEGPDGPPPGAPSGGSTLKIHLPQANGENPEK